MAGISSTLKTNLYAYYDFDADLTDQHTNGYDISSFGSPASGGSAIAQTTLESKVGAGSLSVDLSEGRISTASALLSQWSVNLWYKNDGAIGAGNEARLLSYDAISYRLQIDDDDGGVWKPYYGQLVQGGSTVHGPTISDPTSWNMITVIADRLAATPYLTYVVNGNWAGRVTVSGISANAFYGRFLTVGDNVPAGSGPIGWIDGLGYWTRALDEADVTELYNGGLGMGYANTPSPPGNAPVIRATKSPLLQKYSLPAERERGLIFVEKFASEEDVERNGGTITGSTYSFENGVFSDPDGTNYIRYPEEYSLFGENSFSISMWINPSTIDFSISDCVILRSDTSGERVEIVINNDNPSLEGKIRLRMSDGALTEDTYGSTVIPTNEWTHLAFVVDRDNDIATVYTNSVAGTSNNISTLGSVTPLSGNLDLSVNSATFISDFKDVRFYQGVLTAQEVADLANQSTWNYLNRASIVLPMTMDKHQGSTLLDSKGNEWTITGPDKLPTRGYYFGGGSSELITNSSLNLDVSSGVSFVCQFTFDTLPPVADYLFDTDGVRYYATFEPDGDLQVRFGSAGSTTTISGDFLRTPHVLAVVGDSTGTEIWLDGEIIGTTSAVVAGNVTTVYVGRRQTAIGSHEGQINYLTVHLNKLTPTQIKDLTGKLQRSIQEV
jgi:hypothetical protein